MSMTAYIVDDMEVDRYTARRRLEKSGQFCNILEASSGELFLNDLYCADGNLRPDIGPAPLILMDINMPVMNGFETVSALRSRMTNEGWPTDAVVVILTSSQAARDRIAAEKDSLIRGYFVKPLSKDAVEKMVALM